MAEWLAGRNTARRPAVAAYLGGGAYTDLTVNELLEAFWEHARRHYRTPDGRQSKELNNFHDTFRPIRKLYGVTIASEFSSLKLKRVRQSMIDEGLCRNTINQRIGRIVHTFKWAVSEELIPANVYQAIKTVSGLQRGRHTFGIETALLRFIESRGPPGRGFSCLLELPNALARCSVLVEEFNYEGRTL
jgi:hypothetical protein